jgi:hypothetical protein
MHPHGDGLKKSTSGKKSNQIKLNQIKSNVNNVKNI